MIYKHIKCLGKLVCLVPVLGTAFLLTTVVQLPLMLLYGLLYAIGCHKDGDLPAFLGYDPWFFTAVEYYRNL